MTIIKSEYFIIYIVIKDYYNFNIFAEKSDS